MVIQTEIWKNSDEMNCYTDRCSDTSIFDRKLIGNDEF